ncbi:Putative negative regulator of RcsB-dependent stress response [Formivibrio citricus]|uniref:Negative regulator of RcsB-dependent stress response n=1 Tax=Formivibrio citricus TaxID=83765 RepID=A0A1I4XCS0_9NEIS|nr:tetratricopeptide repeat protein [Formivibrio citricus]SFN23059.1 Putative negative regulator of RcsB-dependent stress response [Formivibrio citricus]
MAFDLQEQEQIAELKAFWHDYGRYIALALVVGAVAFAGSKGWQTWEKSRSLNAAAVYAKAEKAGGDTEKLKAPVAELKKDYVRTAYAARAALLAAGAAFAKKDLAGAKTELEWVVSNAREASLRDMARIRLANVLMDENKLDEALAQLKSPEEQSFGAMFAETRGDVLALKNDIAGAQEAYKQSLAKLKKDAPNYKFVEMKLESLGSR